MKPFNLSQNFMFPSIFGFFVILLIIVIPTVDAQNQEIKQLEYMLETNPDDINVKLQLAVQYYQSGKCEKSIILYDQVLEIRPDYPEVTFGKASCLNELGLPENALSVLDTINPAFKNDNSILLAKGNSHSLLREFEKAGEYYQKVLIKNPDSKAAQNNMVLLAKHLNDHEISGIYQQKLLGENPTPRQLDPQMGNMPYTLPINDSKNYSATVQVQIRNSSNELVAIVESKKILYIPHPFMFQIYDHPSLLVETIENNLGTFEIRKVIQEIEPVVNSYFMDRVTLYNTEGYMVFFAYNMAIPIEDGDRAIIEWIITKKID